MRLEILNLIYKMKSAYFGALSEALDIPPSDLRAILTNLIHEGYLYPTIDVNGPYALTSKGRELRLELSLLEQQEQQNDEDIERVHPQLMPESHRDFGKKLKDSAVDSFIDHLTARLFESLCATLKLIIKLFLFFKP